MVEVYHILMMVILGGILGFFYVIYDLIFDNRNGNWVILFFEYVIWWILVTVFTISYLIFFNITYLRVHSILFAVFGLWLFCRYCKQLSLGIIYKLSSFCGFVDKTLCKILKFLGIIILLPCRMVIGFVNRLMGILKKIVEKFSQFIQKRASNRRKSIV